MPDFGPRQPRVELGQGCRGVRLKRYGKKPQVRTQAADTMTGLKVDMHGHTGTQLGAIHEMPHHKAGRGTTGAADSFKIVCKAGGGAQ